MSTVTIPLPSTMNRRSLTRPLLLIGGSAGIGFETAGRARAEGAKVILTGRMPSASNTLPVRLMP